jgi:hypothetical protein
MPDNGGQVNRTADQFSAREKKAILELEHTPYQNFLIVLHQDEAQVPKNYFVRTRKLQYAFAKKLHEKSKLA